MKKIKEVEISLCPDWIVFAREKIRELEAAHARLKIENRRLADRNTAQVKQMLDGRPKA